MEFLKAVNTSCGSGRTGSVARRFCGSKVARTSMALALVEEVAGLLEIGVMMGDPVSKLWGIWAQRQGQHEPECAAIAAELVGTYGAISVRAMFRAVWRHDLSNLVKKHIGEFKPGWITTMEQICAQGHACT